jgi:hypothetical protein
MVLELTRTRINDVSRKCPIEVALNSPRHRSTRCRAAEFDPTDVAVVEAWACVVPAVESFHLGQFDSGGACIWLLVRDADAPETLATWLIWPDAEQLLVKTIGPKPTQSRHGTLRSALQAVASVSPDQWRSLTLLAARMHASGSAPDLTRSPGDGLKAAA